MGIYFVLRPREQRLAELLKKYGLDDESVDTVSIDENTPPATAETWVVPPSRARVKDIKNNIIFLSLKNRHNKDFLSLNFLSLNNLKNARARVREATTDNSDKFRQWRKTKFGRDFDPVAEAVHHGKTWRDHGYTSRQGLNQRLDTIIAKITQIQKTLKNGDFGNL